MTTPVQSEQYAEFVRASKNIIEHFYKSAVDKYEYEHGVKLTGKESTNDLDKSVLKDMKILISIIERDELATLPQPRPKAGSANLIAAASNSSAKEEPKKERAKCRHNIDPLSKMGGNPQSRQGPCTLCGLIVKECPTCLRAFLYGNASQRNHFHGQHMQKQHGVTGGGGVSVARSTSIVMEPPISTPQVCLPVVEELSASTAAAGLLMMGFEKRRRLDDT